MGKRMSVPDHQPASYDFGLSAEQEDRARKVHRESIIVDLLAQHVGGSNLFECYPSTLLQDLHSRLAACDTAWERLTEAEYWPYLMSRAGGTDLIRDWYRQSGLTCGTYGIGVHDGHDAFSRKLDVVNAALADIPWVRCVTTAQEIRHAKSEGRIALYAHWQPVFPVPRNWSAIDTAYAKGLRSLMLTYNRMDNIGVGCTERVDAGLSMFGVDVVRHCNRIGMIVDVSHCGALTTLDACHHSSKPVNANHTCARGVHLHSRGKTDEGLRAIAGTGGVIGVVAAPPFLTADPRPTIEHMLDHIAYIADLVGWKHVAIGTDWPMQAPREVVQGTLGAEASEIGFREQDRLDLNQRLEGFEDGRDLPNITRGLVKRGFDDEQIRGILGENALRVFTEVWGR